MNYNSIRNERKGDKVKQKEKKQDERKGGGEKKETIMWLQVCCNKEILLF